jgi:hypothetical protein
LYHNGWLEDVQVLIPGKAREKFRKNDEDNHSSSSQFSVVRFPCLYLMLCHVVDDVLYPKIRRTKILFSFEGKGVLILH